ncbi:MAG: hypothetical protein KDD70_03885 [Bdellovibrionales bacterium]|nr:hypothetical protein [Bdellovibrionales bacterium]
MKDSTKKNEEEQQKAKPGSTVRAGSSAKVAERAFTPQQIQDEIDETAIYWKNAVLMLQGEEFDSLNDAVDRVVELASERLGELANDENTQAFMRSALLQSEEVVNILQTNLNIRTKE